MEILCTGRANYCVGLGPTEPYKLAPLPANGKLSLFHIL